jgi:hypothetical protein
MRKILMGIVLISNLNLGFAQVKKEIPKYLGDPMIVDDSNSSMLMVPVFYRLFGIRSGNDLKETHYANILFYNSQSDSIKRLFEEDTYIKPIQLDENPNYVYQKSYFSKKWIFYFVKSSDYNRNGRMDVDDPYILYVSDKNGNGLKALTASNENVISIDIFEKQGCALIKMQKDVNGNEKFGNNEDRDYHYLRLDLNTLTLREGINKNY